jgi:hypothetical protein
MELFYLQKQDYRRALESYLCSEVRRKNVFQFIRTMMDSNKDDPSSQQRRAIIKQAMLDNLTVLVDIDSEACSSMIIETFTQEQELVLSKLEQHRELQFKYLRSVMSVSAQMGELMDKSSTSGSNPSIPSNINSNISNQSGVTQAMHEKYIQLMCEYAPQDVFKYLTLHTEYRLDVCLAYCQQYDIIDATAYLLER